MGAPISFDPSSGMPSYTARRAERNSKAIDTFSQWRKDHPHGDLDAAVATLRATITHMGAWDQFCDLFRDVKKQMLLESVVTLIVFEKGAVTGPDKDRLLRVLQPSGGASMASIAGEAVNYLIRKVKDLGTLGLTLSRKTDVEVPMTPGGNFEGDVKFGSDVPLIAGVKVGCEDVKLDTQPLCDTVQPAASDTPDQVANSPMNLDADCAAAQSTGLDALPGELLGHISTFLQDGDVASLSGVSKVIRQDTFLKERLDLAKWCCEFGRNTGGDPATTWSLEKFRRCMQLDKALGEKDRCSRLTCLAAYLIFLPDTGRQSAQESLRTAVQLLDPSEQLEIKQLIDIAGLKGQGVTAEEAQVLARACVHVPLGCRLIYLARLLEKGAPTAEVQPACLAAHAASVNRVCSGPEGERMRRLMKLSRECRFMGDYGFLEFESPMFDQLIKGSTRLPFKDRQIFLKTLTSERCGLVSFQTTERYPVQDRIHKAIAALVDDVCKQPEQDRLPLLMKLYNYDESQQGYFREDCDNWAWFKALQAAHDHLPAHAQPFFQLMLACKAQSLHRDFQPAAKELLMGRSVVHDAV